MSCCHIANVKQMNSLQMTMCISGQCDNSEQDCGDEAVVQHKTNARHLMNGHLRCLLISI